MQPLEKLIEAARSGARAGDIAAASLPTTYRAAFIHRDDEHLFDDNPPDAESDVRRALRVGEVPTPELAPDEAMVAVMASSINYNTVWSATFRPISTFRFLEAFAANSPDGARHDQPHHVLGTDASGIVVRVGSGVKRWLPGDRVVCASIYNDYEDPALQFDGMLGDQQRAWGFETNFGGLADLAVVKATQLLPKAEHLSWTEAAVVTACNSTGYRMLVSERGARMKQGELVLVWGAAGGLGGYAVQLVKNGGGRCVGVVSSTDKADTLIAMGCDLVIDRREHVADDGSLDWRSMGRAIRATFGDDPRIVFEHTGKDTFAASLQLLRKGGSVVTCGSSSGYDHSYDNRQLWMRLKSIIGSHGANYQEAWDSNELVRMGAIAPTLSRSYSLDDVGAATRSMQMNDHSGKVGIRCLARDDDEGITDPRTRSRITEAVLNRFRTD